MRPVPPIQPFERALNASVAFVWLATALLVLHPHYRAVGAQWLDPLGLPSWLMFPVCAAELVLGLQVLLGRTRTWLALTQLALVAGFTVILAGLEPMLLVHPFGMLTKNLPLLAVVGTGWLLQREGWSSRATWLLRAGMAVVWITEGIGPKVLFQQPTELAVVANSGLVSIDPRLFLMGMGLAQAASGVAALLLRGLPLRFVLACQAAALVALPLMVSWQDPLLWVHPFGPMTKNLPILVGTLVLLRRCSTSR